MAQVSKLRASDTLSYADKGNVKNSVFKNLLVSSPVQIWKSRISWRIIMAVFLTILTVQTIILYLTLPQYKDLQLSHLREIGRSALAPLMSTQTEGMLLSPLSDNDAAKLFTSTIVQGVTVYSSQMDLIKTYGTPISIMLKNQQNLNRTYMSEDGTSYEFILRSSDLGRPYIAAVKIDSSKIQTSIYEYVKQTIMIMLLMSAFVTTVLMIALGYWLLEPILFIRSNLIAASKDPEDPKIQPSPFNPSDEIGGAIQIAQKLILQNAENIKRIKSAAQDKIHKLAYYDTLTALPNRTLFLQTLSEKMRVDSADSTKRFAVIAIDLDHFKDINDSMGHNVGDAIIRGVGKRLRDAMPSSATVSRTGEDEFAIMLPLSTDINTARDVGERVLNVIRGEPFKVFNEQFQVRASIGVATFPKDGIEPDLVLKHADIALNRAKEEGRDTIKEYSEDFDRAVQQRFQMLRDLREALERNELSLYYQPQLDLRTGKIIGAEALLRWWKPDNSKQGGSFISPGDFIPVAEQSSLIIPIGQWVLETACSSAKLWNEKYGLDMRIAVNVSATQFSQGDFVSFVRTMLEQTGLDPHKLELEVTESVFMEDIEHTIETLQDLHALGTEIAIDDFGTGYSSLSYLRQFPIDRLKIDQSFIKNALNNHDDAAIARTIVGLGHSLNLKVIAEGVETKDHEKLLIDYGCDEVQGFRYSRPIPADKFLEFALNYNNDLGSFDN